MSFIKHDNSGRVFAPGWFLVNNEDCDRKTHQMYAVNAVTDNNGEKYIRMGTVYPSNDGNAIGIVYEDVDVTSGDMPGSVVTRGTVYKDRLVALSGAAESALVGKGFKFIATAPGVTRPY